MCQHDQTQLDQTPHDQVEHSQVDHERADHEHSRVDGEVPALPANPSLAQLRTAPKSCDGAPAAATRPTWP